MSAGPPDKIKDTNIPSPSSPPTMLKPNPAALLFSNTCRGALQPDQDSDAKHGHHMALPLQQWTNFTIYMFGDSDVILCTIVTAAMLEVYDVAAM